MARSTQRGCSESEEVAGTRHGLLQLHLLAEARRLQGGPKAHLRGVLDVAAMAVWPRGAETWSPRGSVSSWVRRVGRRGLQRLLEAAAGVKLAPRRGAREGMEQRPAVR